MLLSYWCSICKKRNNDRKSLMKNEGRRRKKTVNSEEEGEKEKNKQNKIEILIWGHLGNLWTPTEFFFKTWLLTIKVSYVVKNEFPIVRVVIFSNFH